MTKVMKNKIIDSIIFTIFCSLAELLTYFIMFKVSFRTYFFLDIIIFAILSLPIYFSKKIKIDMIYIPIMSFIITLLLIVNANFYNAVRDVFSIQYLIFVKEGINVINIHFLDFISIISLTSFWLMFVLGYLYRLIHLPDYSLEKDHPRQRISVIFSMILILVISFIFTIDSVKKYENKKGHSSVNYITLSRVSNFKRFGMLSYYVLESDYLINGSEDNEDELTIYFKTDSSSKKNDYTGLLKDYNVFTIMIETGSRFMVNETLTPNLCTILNDGINCEENISKNKTNVSEFIGISGNYPSLGPNLVAEDDFEMPWSCPSVLNENYRTLYMHDITESVDIYRRIELMKKFGFEETYFHDDINDEIPWTKWNGSYNLDSEAVDGVINQITKSDEKFYAFWTSLSMHGPYYNPDNEEKLNNLYGEKYDKAIEEGKYVNPLKDTVNEVCIRNYMLACMDFDYSLGKIISSFEEKGIYDNTLFVLYGDHDLYYVGADSAPLWKSLFNCDDLTNSEMFKTVFVMSNPILNAKFHNDYKEGIKVLTSPYNIVPTTLDLLGYKYNTKLMVGDSIFKKNFNNTQHVFYSHELTKAFGIGFYSENGENVIESGLYDKTLDIDAVNKITGDNYKKICNVESAYTNKLFNYENYNAFLN